MTNAKDFREELTAVADGERWGAADWDRRRGEHPSDDLLIAYGAGRLDGGDDDRVQEHLTTCRECRALVADLCAFPALEAVAGEPSEFEVAAAWRGVAERIAGSDAVSDDGSTVAAAKPAADGHGPFWTRISVAWTVAATLAFALVGSGAFNLQAVKQKMSLKTELVQTQGLLDEATRPATGSLLELQAGATRSGEDVPAIACAGQPCTLWVTVDSAPENLAWVLRDSAGEEVVSNGLSDKARAALEEKDGFSITVPRGVLAAGRHELHLLADRGAEQPLYRIPFDVVE